MLDSLVLEETDTLYLGNPAAEFLVVPSLGFFIPDRASDRLFLFDRAGHMVRTFGQPGMGPGEFRQIGRTTVVGDSIVGQSTFSRRRFVYFRIADGKFLFERAVNGFPGRAVSAGNRVWVGSLARGSNRGIMTAPTSEFFRSPGQESGEPLTSTLVPLPEEYQRYPGLEMFDSVELAVWSDTLLVGFAGVNYLLRYTVEGDLIDARHLPVRARRGVTEARLRLFLHPNPRYEDAVTALSGMSGLWRLRDGTFLLRHTDAVAVMRGLQPIGGEWHVFFSVLSADLRRACVDTELPTPSMAYPRFAFANDTLFMLDQVAVSESPPRVQSLIRRYQVTTENCEWLSTGRESM